MNIRVIVGVALALLAGWLLLGGLSAVMLITSRGSPLDDALLNPPTSLLRILATGIALIGGLLAVGQIKGGAWLAGLGTLLFLLLTGGMISQGAEAVLWRDEAVFSGVLIALTIALAVLRRGKA